MSRTGPSGPERATARRAARRVAKRAERAPGVEGYEKTLLVDVAHAHVLDLEKLIEAVV